MTLELEVRKDLSAPVGADDGLSVTDKALLAFARRNLSPEEISEEFGGLLTPAQAAQRTREILRSHDWLSQVERRALLLLDMVELKDILMARIRSEGGFVNGKKGSAFVNGDPRWSATLVNLLKEMTRMLEGEQGAIDTARAKLRAQHASLMLRAIEAAFRIMARDLMAAHPDIRDDEMAGLLERSLPAAIALVEEQTEQPE